MVVQHNLRAMNSNRMLGLTQSNQAKSTEKLSSGYKINRAADDAAGLSISEKMRKQMRGLTQASANAQDGISSVQTAEGALTEVHDMLQRMNELATKAANGTMSESDRSYVQNEIDQLVTELDRVSETTKFNETYLLKGNAEGAKSQMKVNAHDAGLAGKLTDNGDTALFEAGEFKDGDKVNIAGREYTIGKSQGSASEISYKTSTAIKDEKLGVGDTLYDADTDKTISVVGKVANSSAAYLAGKTTFEVTAANGEVKKYAVAGTESHTSGVDSVMAANAEQIIATALKAGSTVKMTADANGDAVNYDIVDELDDGQVSGNVEVSIVSSDGKTRTDLTVSVDDIKKNFKDSKVDENDKVTIGGKTTEITDETAISKDKMDEIIDSLIAGDKITIKSQDESGKPLTSAGIEFTIGKETDAANNIYTTGDLKKIVGDFDEIEKIELSTAQDDMDKRAKTTSLVASATGQTETDVKAAIKNGGTFDASMKLTVVPNQVAAANVDTLSKSEAYNKMAEELQKASSIGTDTAAKVASDGKGNFTITKGSVEVVGKLNFNLHVGADADMTNKINVNIDSMSAAGLGVKGLNVTDTTGIAATYAIDAIEDAINKVSTQRSALGAVQNRLEHTINNLDNVVENTTSAESAIRDTDMASEMVKYSNNNILAQAGQAMLAQANQSNQGVLSLLG